MFAHQASFRIWLEEKLGLPLEQLPEGETRVLSTSLPSAPLLWGLHLDQRAALLVQPTVFEAAQACVEKLHPAEVFSIFGAYELSRFTLAEGMGVWGPSWYLALEAESFSPKRDHLGALRSLSGEELQALAQGKAFWHCFPETAIQGFGIVEDDTLLALAAVRPEKDMLWELGVDVSPAAKGGGYGSVVASAAVQWILDQGKSPYATVAPWNIVSTRMLRSLGFRYAFSEMTVLPAPFRVAPQALGRPLPGAPMRHYYPDWAMTPGIMPCSE